MSNAIIKSTPTGYIILEVNNGQIREIENGQTRTKLFYPNEPGRVFYRVGDIILWDYQTPRDLQRAYPYELGKPSQATAGDGLLMVVLFFSGVVDEVYKIKTGMCIESISPHQLILRKVLLFEDGSNKLVGEHEVRGLAELTQALNTNRYFSKDRGFEQTIVNSTMFMVNLLISPTRFIGKNLVKHIGWRFFRQGLTSILLNNLRKFAFAVAKAVVLAMLKEYYQQEKYNLGDAPLHAMDQRKVVEAAIHSILSQGFSTFILPDWMKPVLEQYSGSNWQPRLARLAAETFGNLLFKDQADFFARYLALAGAHARDKTGQEMEQEAEKIIRTLPSHILEAHLTRLVKGIVQALEN